MNRQLGGILQIQKFSPSHLSYFRDTLITKKKKKTVQYVKNT